MRRLALLTAGLIVAICGCSPTPSKFACETYVAGSFTPDNYFSLSLDATGWPPIDGIGDRIVLSVLMPAAQGATVDLVHVVGSEELERWTLRIPNNEGHVPTCIINSDPNLSTCGASVHILPQKVGGYYYLRSGPAIIEAGLSFYLCRQP